MKRLSYLLGLALLGCVGPRPSSDSSDRLRHLENRVGHIETELAARVAEGELAEMTIDYAGN